jgi:soluble lytic murein transglycosylase
MPVPRTAFILAFTGLLLAAHPAPPPQERAAVRVAAVPLQPTAHPALPDDPRALWFAPDGAAGKTGQAGVLLKFAEGVQRFDEGRFREALPLVSAAGMSRTPLADYAAYYTARTHLGLEDVPAAARALESLKDRPMQGYLAEAVLLARAEAAERAQDPRRALALYAELAEGKPVEPEAVYLRIGRTAHAAGDRAKAAAAFRRVRYEFPLSDAAAAADTALRDLADVEPRPDSAATFKRELGRAERLFGARRYTQAREAFQAIRSLAGGDDRELVNLRLAESDFYLRRYAAARDALRPYLTGASRAAEAQFFYLASIRELGQHEEYLSRVRALVDDHPESSWAEEALNNLGTHYILVNEDARSIDAFREVLARFPGGPRGERAAWKLGWWAYKTGDYPETIRVFEQAAATYPRSDYRPSWVYWAARAREHLGDAAFAVDRYRLVTADYLNSYYGRLATRRLEKLEPVARTAFVPRGAVAQEPAAPPPPNEPTIRLFLSLGLEANALNELRYAQRQWGTSPAIEATLAWVFHRRGELRRAINQMRRAYPQYMTADGGSQLPDELLRVIFPLEYWASIQKHSKAHGLDPFLVAALVAQESTFDAAIRSPADAYGLMQVVPGTGRRLARSLGIPYRGTRTLTHAETNLRMGTLYFSRLIRQFGGVHLALAAYNAGENRVVRWVAERPGLERDEFIDDIPFPETQGYVKKILGTAEDYRVLYGKR